MRSSDSDKRLSSTTEKRALWPLLLAVVVALCQAAFFLGDWGKELELSVSDVWFRLRGPQPPPEDVVIIAMDERSYDTLNIPLNQIWPRRKHAELLDKLAEMGARRVVMDVIFAGEGADAEADLALSAALKRTPSVIGADVGTVKQWGDSEYGGRIENLVEPPEIFKQAARQVALARMPEENGVIRRFFMPRSALTAGLPLLYEAAANLAPGAARIPGRYDLINYYGPPGTLPTRSYHSLLDASQPAEFIRDKVVFIGLNLRTDFGAAQKDSYVTPFGGANMFGVEIQATAAQNLLAQRWIERADPRLEAALLFLACLLLALLIFAVKPLQGFLALLLIAVLWALSAYGAFRAGYFVPGAGMILIALPAGFLLSTLRYYVLTYRAQQQVEQAFRLYLSPEMAKKMRHSRALELGGEEVQATALFTDIAGFTRMAESMKAQELSSMLNDYFTEVVNAIFDRRGTVIKFIGDAVFALWGAPVSLPNHAEMACRGALAIQQAVAEFNRRGKYPFLYTRIGINSGPMLVGNLGAARRFDYTAVGDSVNLSSRLESLNKHLGTTMLLSGSVATQLNGALDPLKLGVMRVSGKSRGIELFTLFSRRLAPGASFEWSRALAAYGEKNFVQAREIFLRLSSSELQLAGPSRVYLAEIERLEREGFEAGWSGELLFFEK